MPRFGDTYIRYMNQVSAFIPSLSGKGGMSWKV